MTAFVLLLLLLCLSAVSANTKILHVEFEGIVDKDNVQYMQFCPAMWVTYNQSTWNDATNHCNTTSTRTYELAAKMHGQSITASMVVFVRVDSVGGYNAQLTENLRSTGFLTAADSVSYVSDKLLNAAMVTGVTVGVAFSVFLFIVLIYWLS